MSHGDGIVRSIRKGGGTKCREIQGEHKMEGDGRGRKVFVELSSQRLSITSLVLPIDPFPDLRRRGQQ